MLHFSEKATLVLLALRLQKNEKVRMATLAHVTELSLQEVSQGLVELILGGKYEVVFEGTVQAKAIEEEVLQDARVLD